MFLIQFRVLIVLVFGAKNNLWLYWHPQIAPKLVSLNILLIILPTHVLINCVEKFSKWVMFLIVLRFQFVELY